MAQQGLSYRTFAVAGPARDLRASLSDFLSVGGIWGTALMVYLNRQSARRLLARLRADELERAQAERRLIASRLAATETQMDPGSVLRQLGAVRDLYADGKAEADERLDGLDHGAARDGGTRRGGAVGCRAQHERRRAAMIAEDEPLIRREIREMLGGTVARADHPGRSR